MRDNANIGATELLVRNEVANATGVPVEFIYVRISQSSNSDGGRRRMQDGSIYDVTISFSPERKHAIPTVPDDRTLVTMLEPLKTIATENSIVQVVSVSVSQQTSLPEIFDTPHVENENMDDDQSGFIVAVSVVVACVAVAGIVMLTWYIVTNRSTGDGQATNIQVGKDHRGRFGRVNVAEIKIHGNTAGKKLRLGPLGVVRSAKTITKPPVGRPWTPNRSVTTESESAPLFGAPARPKPSSMLKSSDLKLKSIDFR